ncbi:hypothetical protein F443_08937, partial [Phytophthora nicotianae P1569]
IECKAPGLTPLRRRALDRLRTWPAHEFLHVKRDWNQSTDRLANTALHQQDGTAVTLDADCDDLVVLNRLKELLLPKNEESVARMTALTRSRTRSKNSAEVLQLDVAYLSGDLENLDADKARARSKLADEYDVDDGGLLLYRPRAGRDDGDRDRLAKLVVPEDLQQDSVQRYVGQCTDCETGKGRPTLRGESPGNIQATYSFQCIAMDHIPALPRSYKENTKLLNWVDLFTGYVIAYASASRTSQTIAQNYEKCVFRKFEASEPSGTIGSQDSYINQKDWDEYAKRLTFALNTAYDRIRGETPFYLQVFFVFAIPGTRLTLAHPTTRYRRTYARSKLERLDCLTRTLFNAHSRPTAKGSGKRVKEGRRFADLRYPGLRPTSAPKTVDLTPQDRQLKTVIDAASRSIPAAVKRPAVYPDRQRKPPKRRFRDHPKSESAHRRVHKVSITTSRKIGVPAPIVGSSGAVCKRTSAISYFRRTTSLQDARSTLEATLPLGNTQRRDMKPRRWRYNVQRQYQQARKLVNKALHAAIEGRADQHNEDASSHDIKAGDQVWLYLDRVKESYARKLAHMWHRPFRVTGTVDRHAVCLETPCTAYRLFPIVHVSKRKLVKSYPERPTSTQTNREANRVDFDEGLLPEDSWERELEED